MRKVLTSIDCPLVRDDANCALRGLVPEEVFAEEGLHGFFLVVFISRSIRDNSVLHVPCLEVAVSGAYLIDSHVIVIDEINESILQNDS